MAQSIQADYGHRLTERALSSLEKQLKDIYKEARDELDATVKSYFLDFERRDKAMKAQLDAGKIDESYYTQWRLNQIGRGERFEALRDEMAERYFHANELAMAYLNDETPGIYSLNHNYIGYTIEQAAGDIGFTLLDEQTVRRLAVENPNLMPHYPEQRAVERGIDLAWGKKQITASVTSSILQGKGVREIADDLQTRIETMERSSAIRTARTATTGAENAGRLDGLLKAQARGIDAGKEWIATIDGRTRHSHLMVDGEVVPTEGKFSNGLRYPGDPAGPGREVYNCRCTMAADVKRVREAEPAKRRIQNPETGKYELIDDMSYREWEKWKRSTQQVENVGENDIIFKSFYTGDEVNDFFNYDSEERGLFAQKSSLHRRWLDNLSNDERDAISWYTRDGYGDINDYWRRRDGWESIPAEMVEDASKQIDNAISRFTLKENIVVQRGVQDFYGESLVESRKWNDIHEIVGMTYHDSGYSSTTALIGNSVATAKPYLFEIEIPAGVGRGAYVNKLAGINEDVEYEFMIARGSRFEITGVEINDEPIPPQTIIRMRLIVDE